MARKKTVVVEQKRDMGIFLFTSLMLILLTFFIVLASMSIRDGRKQRLALDSLTGGFGILPGGRSPFKTENGKDILPQSAPMKDQSSDIRQVRAALAQDGITNDTGVSEGMLGVTITLKSNVLFKTGTDRLSEDSFKLLDSLARFVAKTDNNIIITGHTDSIPVEVPPYYSNWGLSAARALAVLNHLKNKGIPSARLAAYGMGSQRPITSNTDEYGRGLNRRVEITFLGDIKGGISSHDVEDANQGFNSTIFVKGFRFHLEEQ